MFITKIFRVAQQNKSTHLTDIGKINGKICFPKEGNQISPYIRVVPSIEPQIITENKGTKRYCNENVKQKHVYAVA